MTDEEKNEQADDAAADAPSADEMPEVMTVRQAAEYLQVNEQVLYRYVREGKVPSVRMGATIRFKRSILDAWLERDSWDSVGVRPPTEGKARTRPKPSRPRLDMEID